MSFQNSEASELPVLVSMSAFKGTLSNEDACEIVASALHSIPLKANCLPIGDGGAGSLSCVKATLGGEVETFDATGPLGKPVRAKVLCLPDKKAPHSLYVETSEVCGYSLVPAAERDIMRASSRGLGELLRLCYARFKGSLKKIFVGLGDSAISDAGMGLLSEMGYSFVDHGGRVIWANAEGLRQARTISMPKVPPFGDIQFTVLCDVVNPLLGRQGSARVFAPQKGASPAQVQLIESGMENFVGLVQTATGQDVGSLPMTGSAGGLAAAFSAFFRTELVQGARFLFDWTHYEKILARHSLIVTGEGQTDAQTLSGKAPGVCAEFARRLEKPCVVISGRLGAGYEDLARGRALSGCYACGDQPSAKEALFEKTKEVFKLGKLAFSSPDGEGKN